jgi:hypothetical protein
LLLSTPRRDERTNSNLRYHAHTTMFVTKADVPAYLHDSDLYCSLSDCDSEDAFEVSSEHLKPNDTVLNDQDLHHLLATLRFWGITSVLDTVSVYMSTVEESRSLIAEYRQTFPYLTTLFELKDVTKTEDKFVTAINLGDIAVIEYLRETETSPFCAFHELSCNATGRYIALTAEHGHMECLKYLHKHGFSWTVTATLCAAENGHIHILRYLHEAGCPWNLEVCCAAARNGHLQCLQYAHEQGCDWDKWTCYYASQNNHADCLAYAHDNGCPWTSATCVIAAKKGNFECLKYAHEHGCPWAKSVAYTCAEQGALECLKYAHEHGCPWNAGTCAFAASANQLACLQYAHEQGCPWDANTCSVAASGGFLECLKYARRHGCPWDQRTTYTAARYNRLTCLKYAVEHGCPCEEWVLREYYERCDGSSARIVAHRARDVMNSVASLFCRF